MLNEQIREMLVNYRKENDLSREQLADILHISKSLIGMYERGERIISMEVANHICSLVGKEIAITNIENKEKTPETKRDERSRYEKFEETFQDWIHLGDDNGRGVYRILKDFKSKEGKMITVEVHEYGLHLYKIDGTHRPITLEEYDELIASDPTPYLDKYIIFDEEKITQDRHHQLPFDEKINKMLKETTDRFLSIAYKG